MKQPNKLSSLIPYDQLLLEQKIATEKNSDSGLSQVHDALNLDFLLKLALMPDYHHGYLLPIGGVALLDRVISPKYVGYDIGCGMCGIVTDVDMKDVIPDNVAGRNIYDKMLSKIPVGMNWHDTAIDYYVFESAMGDKNLEKAVSKRICVQLGTLGGGNHFLEIGSNSENKLSVVLHSGSRRPGWEVAHRYMALANEEDKHLPNGFLDLNGNLGESYVEDMTFFLDYALLNRKIMMKEALDILGFRASEVNTLISERMINENHNHAIVYQNSTVLHRKGATPAEKGVKGVIPGNILVGTAITVGLGNEEYLSSASHGAGRTFSRKAAKKELDNNPGLMAEIEEKMRDIICPRLPQINDELPNAYKDLDQVLSYQDGIVVDVLDRIKPKIVVKGIKEKRKKKTT